MCIRDRVIGVPSRKYGEEVMAVIIPKEGVEVTEEEIRQFALERIARYKTPKYIKFVDAFPMNAAGKILKYKMREIYGAEIGEKEAI